MKVSQPWGNALDDRYKITELDSELTVPRVGSKRPWHAPQLLLTEVNLTSIAVSSTVVDDGPASFYS